ncbi:polysaccharide deacetylase family protein [Flavisphingomonas formosensis]|uniref:polysaccharide deacetylase family protein n=1 Tax=Flavisphingomonas formosensis TaxID=861534 RepID=UPI0012FAAD8B|nr:polysaccharide deacetylase family protein [Sphingomonas formosensis]
MERFTVCLTFDFDAISGWITTVGTRNPSMISRGEFGAFAIPRILALLDRYDIAASFAVPGHTAYAYPDEVRMIRDAGHEILHHGWMHENPSDLDEARERRVLEQGLEALHAVAGVVPAGYRSPAWDISPHTLGLLMEYGFFYDSSFMARDFHPYYLRDGDVISADGPYVFGREVELVEMPVAWQIVSHRMV